MNYSELTINTGYFMRKEELSLCPWCHCMTWTIRKPALSASENKHYRYECGKCKAKKELECIKRLKKVAKDDK